MTTFAAIAVSSVGGKCGNHPDVFYTFAKTAFFTCAPAGLFDCHLPISKNIQVTYLYIVLGQRDILCEEKIAH